MSFKAVCGLILVLLSARGNDARNDIRVTYTQNNVCAVKGSTASLRCDVKPQAQKVIWVVGSRSVDLKADQQYSNRVRYYEDFERRRIKIGDVRESDSAEYQCRVKTQPPDVNLTGSPGVSLSVTELQVKVKVMDSSSLRMMLECHSSCQPSTTYIWYMNGQKISAPTSSTWPVYYWSGSSYSCAVEGQEKFASSPVCVGGSEQCYKVTYDTGNICATVNSSVDISCSYNSLENITSKLWFSVGLNGTSFFPHGSRGRIQVIETKQGRSKLRITELRKSDTAMYHFKFQTSKLTWTNDLPGTTLTVTALQIKVIVATTGQFGFNVTLKCHCTCISASHPTFVWFRHDSRLAETQTSLYEGWISPGDAISCALAGHEDHRSLPVYIPRPPSVSVAPSAVVEEGSSLTLKCNSDDNAEANYTWYKEDEDSPLASGQSLTITNFQAEHNGFYYCVEWNKMGLVNSSSHLVAVAGSKTSLIVGSVVAVFLTIGFISVSILITRQMLKRRSERRAISNIQLSSLQEGMLDNIRVNVSKNQNEPLYENIRSARPPRTSMV